jgi:hypothetical protein
VREIEKKSGKEKEDQKKTPPSSFRIGKKYVPVVVKSLQWARVFKEIDLNGSRGISVYNLAEDLGVEPTSVELEKSIDLLLRQQRIRVSMGVDEDGMTCRFVQAFVPKKAR